MLTRTPHTVLSGFGLSLGITLTWLSLIVLIPLSAVFIKSAQIDLPDLINILSSERIQRALWLRQTLKTFPSGFPAIRIDHLFVSPQVRPIRVFAPFSPLARMASDHLPLVFDFELQPA